MCRNKTGSVFAAALFAVLLLTSCFGQRDGNMPYEPDTPAPAPHEGVFVSDWGTMTFSGVGMVTPERIPLLFSDGGFRDVQFLKE